MVWGGVASIQDKALLIAQTVQCLISYQVYNVYLINTEPEKISPSPRRGNKMKNTINLVNNIFTPCNSSLPKVTQTYEAYNRFL